MRALFTLFMSAMAGCSLMLTEAPVECADLLDCPTGEVCREGLCIGAPGRTADLTDASLDDGMMDSPEVGTRSAPYPAGICFEEMSGALPSPESLAHIPRGYCSEWGIVWSEPGAEHDTLVVRGQETDVEDQRLDRIVGTAHVTARTLYVARMNTLEDAANIWRQDLITGEGEFIKPSSRDQEQPSRGANFTALTETNPEGAARVLIRFDDGIVHDCGRPGYHQRGPVAGDDWVAWVEERPGSRVSRVIVTKVAQCRSPENHRTRLLMGRVPEGHRLHRAGDTLVWLAHTADQGTLLRTWRHLESGQEPESIALPDEVGTPSELTAHDARVALVFYRNRSPRFTLEVVNLVTRSRRPIATQGNVHHPTLTDRYILWSQGGGATGWEVRYDTID